MGLGNPGPEYENTRHNIGFTVLDYLLRKLKKEEVSFKNDPPLFAYTAEPSIKGRRVLLVKPQTFMNNSGKSVKALINRKILTDPEDLLVVHDDLDLALGKMKFVRRAGSGGHRGVESIINHIGHNRFNRLRLGIGRPAATYQVESFVLSPFSDEEAVIVKQLIQTASEAIICCLTQGIGRAMNIYHSPHKKA